MKKEEFYESVNDAIKVFDSGDTEEAKKLLRNLFKERNLKIIDGELYDLAMEFYIFIYDGDLRKEGRDFGFSNTGEIRRELDKIKLKMK